MNWLKCVAIAGFVLFGASGMALADCPAVPAIARTPSTGSPFAQGNRDVTRMDTQTSDNVRITGGCIEPTRLGDNYFARAYGTCRWDSSHDVGACINLAIAAAAANGGGQVVYPCGTFGVSTTIVNNTSLVRLASHCGGGGRHAVGTNPTGGTVFRWIGEAGGTIMQIKPITGASSQALTGAGVVDTTFNCDGSSVAGIGLYIANIRQSDIGNLMFNECSTAGLYATTETPLGEVEGITQNNIFNIQTYNVGNGNGAPGIVLNGTLLGNSSHNRWSTINTLFKDGPGIRLIEADSEIFISVKFFRSAGGVAPCAIDLNQSYTLSLGVNSNHFYTVSGSAGSGSVASFCAVGTGGIDGVTNTDTSFVSATGSFAPHDVGQEITGTNIAGGTTIASVTNPTTIVLSQATTGTGTGLTYAITGRSAALKNTAQNIFTPVSVAVPLIGTGATFLYCLDTGKCTGYDLVDPILEGFKVSTSTLTKTNNTTANGIPGLTMSPTIGKTYNCRAHLSGTSGAAGGFKVVWTTVGLGAATSARWTGIAWNGTTPVAHATTTGLAGSVIVNADAVYTDIYIEGSVVLGSAASSPSAAPQILLGGAQNTSDGTDTTFLQGSTFSCVRVN